MNAGSRPGGTPGEEEAAALVFRLAGDQTATAARVAAAEDRLEDVASTVDSVLDRVEGVALAVDDIETFVSQLAELATAPPDPSDTSPSPTDASGEGEDVETGLDMRVLVEWVRDNVAQLIERKLPQSSYPYWCRRWWMHPEAIARFEAVRRSWAEAVSAGIGNALVVYFEHLDHHLGVLCSDNGPFSGCTGGIHSARSEVVVLGQDEPDEAYFLEFDHARDLGTAETASPPLPPPAPAQPPPPAPLTIGGPRVRTHR